MFRYKIILNPFAGRGTAAQMIPAIETAMKNLGVDYDLALTEYPWHAAELAEKAITEGYDAVVAAGGDGTINEVINGIMLSRQAGFGTARLGVLPIGRGNDFAFSMGLPVEFDACCRALADGSLKSIDIGRISGGTYPDGRFFGNGVGVGFDAVVGFIASQSRLTGFLSYLVAAMKTIFLYFKPPTVAIEMEQETITQPSLMVSIMNGRRMGGGFMMAPEGDPTDHQLDLCIVANVRKPVIFVLFPRVMNGTQAGHPAVQYRKSSHLHVRAVEGTLPVHADGETICTHGSEISIELLPAQIELITPKEQNPQ
jgi:diacylglycerol kinase (ATP)